MEVKSLTRKEIDPVNISMYVWEGLNETKGIGLLNSRESLPIKMALLPTVVLAIPPLSKGSDLPSFEKMVIFPLESLLKQENAGFPQDLDLSPIFVSRQLPIAKS